MDQLNDQSTLDNGGGISDHLGAHREILARNSRNLERNLQILGPDKASELRNEALHAIAEDFEISDELMQSIINNFEEADINSQL